MQWLHSVPCTSTQLLLTGAGEGVGATVGAAVVGAAVVGVGATVVVAGAAVVGAGVGAGVAAGVGAGVASGSGSGCGSGSGSYAAHTAFTTKLLSLHFVPVGTGFIIGTPWAHWYHQSPHCESQMMPLAGTVLQTDEEPAPLLLKSLQFPSASPFPLTQRPS